MNNLPASVIDELRNINGFDAATFLAAHTQPPLTSIRINPGKECHLFADNEPVAWCPAGRYLNERPVFTLDPFYHTGAYYVQEASSMFLDRILRQHLDGRTGLRVLDLCAAPGGKSTLIASLLDKDSLLISNDVIRSRATILEENMTRWGQMNTWVTSNDPRDLGRLTGYFDVIVVDAPCSGSGLWRKDAGALNEWSEANVQLCGERQQRILADIWPALKEGGLLVYATCSYSPAEDEQILDWLASTYDVSSLTTDIQSNWNIITTESPINKMAGYRFFPGISKGEGLYIATLRKNDQAETLQYPRFKSQHNPKVLQQAGYLLRDQPINCLLTGKEDFSAMVPDHEKDWHLLQQKVYLRKAGLNLGMPSGKDWLPAHDVALSVDVAADIPFVDVSKEQALRFLKREEMGIEDIEKGWKVVKYNGLGLGWIKALGNRVNNYLPKHWRIRMELGASSEELF